MRIVGIVLAVIAIGFLIGAYDDQNAARKNTEQTLDLKEGTMFDPWKDEWYGIGPWWKKW